MLGMPPMAELLDGMMPSFDPDAVTLDDLALRLDELTARVEQLAGVLAPVVELADVAKNNADKLRRFGIKW
jgi:hypothetical protein